MLAAGVVCAALASVATAVPRACCLPNGTCEELSRAVCEDQMGGNSEVPGTNCTQVECPVLCNGTSAPACGGECPPTLVCAPAVNGQATTSGNGPAPCLCFPEIPAGGACDPASDQCAPGLECINNVCTAPPALAPALSPLGLAALAAALTVLGGAALMRRRRQ
jgi:hypothetical protein